MIYIKRVFPDNFYLLRKVKVKQDNKTVTKIGHAETTPMSAEGSQLEFKIDYHKAQLQMPQAGEDHYYVLYFDIRNSFPLNYTDMMFKNALRIKKVNENEFKSLNSKDFYTSEDEETIKPDSGKIFSVVASVLIAGLFVLSPYLFEKSDANNFAFIIGLAGILGFAELIIFFRKKTKPQYTIRIIAFTVLSIILLYFMDMDNSLKIISGALVLSVLLITLKKEILKLLNKLPRN
jgi:hypothetical protein